MPGSDHRFCPGYERPPFAGLVAGYPGAEMPLGSLAREAYQQWAATRPEVAGPLHLAAVRHPTWPESSSRGGGTTLAEATKALLENWNAQLPGLRDHVTPDSPVELRPYG